MALQYPVAYHITIPCADCKYIRRIKPGDLSQYDRDVDKLGCSLHKVVVDRQATCKDAERWK